MEPSHEVGRKLGRPREARRRTVEREAGSNRKSSKQLKCIAKSAEDGTQAWLMPYVPRGIKDLKNLFLILLFILLLVLIFISLVAL